MRCQSSVFFDAYSTSNLMNFRFRRTIFDELSRKIALQARKIATLKPFLQTRRDFDQGVSPAGDVTRELPRRPSAGTGCSQGAPPAGPARRHGMRPGFPAGLSPAGPAQRHGMPGRGCGQGSLHRSSSEPRRSPAGSAQSHGTRPGRPPQIQLEQRS